MTWNSSEWNDVDSLRIEPGSLWIPDITPYNGEQSRASFVTIHNDVPNVSRLLSTMGKIGMAILTYPNTSGKIEMAISTKPDLSGCVREVKKSHSWFL